MMKAEEYKRMKSEEFIGGLRRINIFKNESIGMYGRTKAEEYI